MLPEENPLPVNPVLVCRITVALAAFLVIGPPSTLSAGNAAAEICDTAAAEAARRSGVPVGVLRAITRTETGRGGGGGLEPWPWTVNMEGVGKWFDDRAAAMTYVRQHHARGARSYDIGCFQINYRWHGDAFESLEAMFDPVTNALYAARFLTELYHETGAWPRAAAAYHSRTPKYAERYRKRFERILAQLGAGELPPPPAAGGGASVATRDFAPIEIAGPLTVSPPSAGRLGSAAAIDALPGRRPLLMRAPGPLF